MSAISIMTITTYYDLLVVFVPRLLLACNCTSILLRFGHDVAFPKKLLVSYLVCAIHSLFFANLIIIWGPSNIESLDGVSIR